MNTPNFARRSQNQSLSLILKLPLIKELIPILLTNMLSISSEDVNSSATTYRSGRTFLASSRRYYVIKNQRSELVSSQSWEQLTLFNVHRGSISNMLLISSEDLNSSATTYNSGRIFLASLRRYCVIKNQRSELIWTHMSITINIIQCSLRFYINHLFWRCGHLNNYVQVWSEFSRGITKVRMNWRMKNQSIELLSAKNLSLHKYKLIVTESSE